MLFVCGVGWPATAAAVGDPNDWLGTINSYRSASGVATVAEDPAWDAGIAAHLVYMEKTPSTDFTGAYQSLHTENPASPYYTAAGAAEAGYSDLAEGAGTTPVSAIDDWLGAPFHAIGMLRAQLKYVAFASDVSTGYAGLDVIQGLDSSVPAVTSPILFPGPGITTDLDAYSGGESPDPLKTCGWQETSAGIGLPLVALLTQAPVAGLIATLSGPNGTASSTGGGLCIVDQSTYVSPDPVYGPTGLTILQNDHAVLLIPAAPLVNGVYTATINQPARAAINWSFTVASPPPSNLAPPSINGTAIFGSELYANPGTWSQGNGAPADTIADQWLDCDAGGATCTAIAGATGQTYTIAVGDIGHTLRVSQTATSLGGTSAAVLSVPTSVIPNRAEPGGGNGSGGAGGSAGSGGSGDGSVSGRGSGQTHRPQGAAVASLGRVTISGGSARVVVGCNGQVGQTCAVTLTLTVVRTRRHKRTTVVVGRQQVTVAATREATKTVSLNAAGRKLRKRSPVHSTLTATSTSHAIATKSVVFKQITPRLQTHNAHPGISAQSTS